MSDVLVRITAPHFVAGLIARDGKVVEAAPILRRQMLEQDGTTVAFICRRRGWSWERVAALHPVELEVSEGV